MTDREPPAPTRRELLTTVQTHFEGDEEEGVRRPSAFLHGRIGRYALLRLLGRGGLGVVYAAYDEELDRRVALKFLRSQSPGARERVLREAQALAQLSHQNVVQIFEVGEHEHDTYLAMEFVDGQTLREWLAEKKPAAAEILRVFRLAGEGVAAAHAAGLIHRDFKPENVLVTADGAVKVLDFGLARSGRLTPAEPVDLDAELASADTPGRSWLEVQLTAVGTAMGTPAYMAPEQMRGDALDARADQFSFCVAAWEALHGARPFAGGSLRERMDSIRRGPAEAPRRPLPRGVTAALERGLSPDPDRRWGSMEQLLVRLQPPKRPWVSIGLLGGVVVAAGLAGYLLTTDEDACRESDEVAQLWSSDAQAELRDSFDATQMPFARHSFEHVTERIDAFVDTWQDGFVDACQRHRRGEQSAQLLDARMRCLERRHGQLRATLESLRSMDANTIERATRTVENLDSPSQCNDAERVQRDDVPAEIAPVVEEVVAQIDRGVVLCNAGQFAECLQLAELADREARAIEHGPIQARARSHLSNALDHNGQAEAAHAAALEALSLAVEHGEAVAATAASRNIIFELAHQETKKQSALALVPTMLAFSRRTGEPKWRASALSAAALAHSRADDQPRADELHQQAIALVEREMGPKDPQLINLMSNWASELTYIDREGEALPLLLRSVEIAEATYGPDHVHLVHPLGNLANAYWGARDVDRAEEIHTRILDLIRDSRGEDHADLWVPLNSLGLIAQGRGDQNTATRLFREAEEIAIKRLPPDHRWRVQGMKNKTVNLIATGRHQEALDFARAHVDEQGLSEFLGVMIIEALLEMNRVDEAETELERRNIPETDTLLYTGLFAHRRGDRKRAHALILESIAAAERIYGTRPTSLSGLGAALGRTLLSMGRPAEARIELERAFSHWDPGIPPWKWARSRQALARAIVEEARLAGTEPDLEAARTNARDAIDRFSQMGPAYAAERDEAAAWAQRELGL